MREKASTFAYYGMKGAAKLANSAEAIEHDLPTKSLVELVEATD
jgi:hypothetical protein